VSQSLHSVSSSVALEGGDLGSDEAVIARVLRGDIALFEVILRRHNLRMYRIVRAILGEDDEAEDVLQDAYVRAFAHLTSFQGHAAFSTWLTRIAVHEALARLRRRHRVVSLDDESDDGGAGFASPHRTPERDAYHGELRHELERAIDGLPPAFRTVFVLRVVEDMSSEAVALLLEIPEETVRTRLHRARGLLQRTLLDRLASTLHDVFAFDGRRCDRVVEAVLRRIT
jgi:RNA polymerase sigma-70 factor (ECF subfamily)